MNYIKQKILNTNLFENNIFLDKYCQLIVEQKHANLPKNNNTNVHHIIPKCYFKLMNLTTDETKDNKVRLNISNHILAHYYLCKCCKENTKLYFLLLCALSMLVNKKDNLNELLDNFDKINLLDIEFLMGEKNKNLSIKQKGNKYALGNKLSEETKLKMKISRTGKSLHSNTKNKIANKTLNTHWINKDNQFKRVKIEQLDFFLKDGWKLGGKAISKEQKEMISLKNFGKKRTQESKNKMSEKAKGRISWNKGISCSEKVKNKISIAKKNQNKHWYTNGEKNIFCNECPSGFVKGRTISEETKIKCGKKNIGKTPWNKGKKKGN